MPTYYAPQPFVPQFLDASGLPLVDGSLKAYLRGTSTPTNMFSDSSGTSLGSSVTLNSRGEPQSSGGATVIIFLDADIEYKFELLDSDSNSIWSLDSINNASAANSGFFATVEEMKGDDSLVSGGIVFTAGYHAADDGGAAKYLIRTRGEFGGSPDEKGDHTLDNGNIAKLMIDDNPANVKQYGAKGDGSTDDTTSIAAALLAQTRLQFTGAGADYRVSSTLSLKNGHFLSGEEIGSGVFIQMTGGDPVFQSGTLGVTAVTDVYIENLSIYNLGSKPSGSIGVDLTDISNSTIRNCRLRAHESGIAMAGSVAGYYNEIMYCEIASNTNGLKYGSSGNSNRVFGGRIHGNLYGANIANINDFHLDTTFENNEYGIYIASTVIDGTIKCRFEGNGDFLGTSTRNPLAGSIVIESGASGITDLGSHYSGESDKVVDKSRNLYSVARGNSGAIDGCPQPSSIMYNADFSLNTGGLANGWNVNPSIPSGTTYSGDVVTKETGSRSQKIEVTGATTVSTLYNSFNVDIGVPYTVSVRIQTNEDEGWRMLIGSGIDQSQYRLSLIRNTGGFATYTGTFVPTTNIVFVNFQMQAGTTSVTGATLNIDSIACNSGLAPGIPGKRAKIVQEASTTAARPPNPQRGEAYFDITIGKPIWHDGTNWVDATGATV